ncbi:lipid-A-disaccharide synthase [candidate division KSB1 bacterium]|nr:lipid-A-disaccharide synthase [candidate division KSB1 bacterium]MBL7095195.1 lipid-A-disaccharide synthase [candidate division KSB1 bacterium]
MTNKIMIIAGEASGDLHGSGLVRELKEKDPNLRIFGIGGDKMQQSGMELIYHVNEMSVLGFLDVLKQFRFFKRVYKHLVDKLEKEQPAVLVLIDYPGLNLKLANAAHQKGIKVLYYIAPQVWAWGKKRVKKMAQTVDKMAIIIPFEEKMYRDARIDATFVGHPLLETLKTKLTKNELFTRHGLNPNLKTIGLLPGSRPLEVKRLLPEMLRTIKLLKNSHPNIQVVLGKADSLDLEIYKQVIPETNEVQLLENSTYEIMKHSDLLIVASGTATLESALLETPLIIVYKVDRLSYFIGRMLVKIDSIGLVNVIAEKRIVPEFIQHQFKAENLIPEMENLLFDQKRKAKMIKDLSEIKQKLGKAGAAEKTAQMVLGMM